MCITFHTILCLYRLLCFGAVSGEKFNLVGTLGDTERRIFSFEYYLISKKLS